MCLTKLHPNHVLDVSISLLHELGLGHVHQSES